MYMTARFAGALCAVALGVASATAQTPDAIPEQRTQPAPATFSEQEQEVWAHEEMFWKTLQEKDLEGHMKLYADDIAAWSGRRVFSKSEWRAARIRNFAERGDGPYVYTLEPLSVKVYGDVGVVYQHVRTSWTDVEGKPRSYDRILNHVYRKMADGWKIIAGAGLQPPSEK
ncbi:MAG TPA: DUF4440 domain-containing protein [Thermoanaerobaculia bacterium]|nr:DUF4440 domain-containing protein [Thermoanaerobaculia bacterium]